MSEQTHSPLWHQCLDYLYTYLTPERQKRFEDILKYRTQHVAVMLEDLFQPHNASAAVRSCDCFGIQDIYVVQNEYEFQTTKGVSMGAEKWSTLHHYEEQGVNNSAACIVDLKKKGYKIAATTPHTESVMIHELPLNEPVVLMFGSEKPGLTEQAMDVADYHVKIPMFGFTESYNISVSVALSLYEITRRLHTMPGEVWELNLRTKNELRMDWARKSIKPAKELLLRYLSDHNLSAEGTELDIENWPSAF